MGIIFPYYSRLDLLLANINNKKNGHGVVGSALTLTAKSRLLYTDKVAGF